MRDRRRTASTWIGLALVIAALSPQVAAAADGSLTRLDGKAGCLSAAGERGMPGCTHVRGLGEPRGVAVSPGGRSLYVTLGAHGHDCRFSPQPPAGRAAPAASPQTDCADTQGLTPTAIALSRDGRNAYVTSGGARPGTIPFPFPRGPDAVALYRRTN